MKASISADDIGIAASLNLQPGDVMETCSHGDGDDESDESGEGYYGMRSAPGKREISANRITNDQSSVMAKRFRI